MKEKAPDHQFAARFAECLRDSGMDRLTQTELGNTKPATTVKPSFARVIPFAKK